MKKGLFSLSYWGPISYYAKLIRYEEVVLEQFDNFQKQSYRNRCYIDGPNGALMLNLSIDHLHKGLMKETRIAPEQNWSQQHWQALQTSYNNSPFFDSLAPEIQSFYEHAPAHLAEVNLASTRLVLKWLRADVKLHLSESWQATWPEIQDHRQDFSPKKRSFVQAKPYPQVFDHKHGFQPELSILDLIFNEGPAAYDYLQEL